MKVKHGDKIIDTSIRGGDNKVIVKIDLTVDKVKALINLLEDIDDSMIGYKQTQQTLLKYLELNIQETKYNL